MHPQPRRLRTRQDAKLQRCTAENPGGHSEDKHTESDITSSSGGQFLCEGVSLSVVGNVKEGKLASSCREGKQQQQAAIDNEEAQNQRPGRYRSFEGHKQLDVSKTSESQVSALPEMYVYQRRRRGKHKANADCQFSKEVGRGEAGATEHGKVERAEAEESNFLDSCARGGGSKQQSTTRIEDVNSPQDCRRHGGPADRHTDIADENYYGSFKTYKRLRRRFKGLAALENAAANDSNALEVFCPVAESKEGNECTVPTSCVIFEGLEEQQVVVGGAKVEKCEALEQCGGRGELEACEVLRPLKSKRNRGYERPVVSVTAKPKRWNSLDKSGSSNENKRRLRSATSLPIVALPAQQQQQTLLPQILLQQTLLTSKLNAGHQLRVRPEREPWIRAIIEVEHDEGKGRSVLAHVQSLIKDFHPQRYQLPFDIPIHQEIKIWDRWWMVKTSSLGPGAGLGVFAFEDIIVTNKCAPVELFPYAGPEYSCDAWKNLTHAFPKLKTYGMCCNEVSRINEADRRYIDGTPENTGNISGYINSSYWSPETTNCEWIEGNGGHSKLDPRVDTYVMTVATKTIYSGEELFVSYALPPEEVMIKRKGKQQ